MPLCVNIKIGENTSQQYQYNGIGNGNRVLNAAMKYYDKFLPRGATSGTSTYYCNALIGCTLQDLGIWDTYSNANGNLTLLKNDPRFVEINYTSGEKALPGDIMCIERKGRTGHNMICASVDGNGRVSKIITAGKTSDPAGKNHVSFMDGNYPSIGSSDYKNLHLFRLK